MENTILSILGLTAWALFLLAGIVILRTSLTLAGGRAANSFGTDGEDVSPFAARLCRAHANCYEFLPFVLVILLYALITKQTDLTNGLALFMLFSRIGQSVVHVISTHHFAVIIRFAFFLPQVGIAFYWIVKLWP